MPQQELDAAPAVSWSSFSLCTAAKGLTVKRKSKKQLGKSAVQSSAKSAAAAASSCIRADIARSEGRCSSSTTGGGGGKGKSKGTADSDGVTREQLLQSRLARVSGGGGAPNNSLIPIHWRLRESNKTMLRAFDRFGRFFSSRAACSTENKHILSEWAAHIYNKVDESNSEFSGRLLEYFMCTYIRRHNVVYYLYNEPTEYSKSKAVKGRPKSPKATRKIMANANAATRGGVRYFESLAELGRHCADAVRTRSYYTVNLQREYAQMIRRYHKEGFDLFRRGRKVSFTYTDVAQRNKRCTLKMTQCSLIFFWWAACLRVHDFWKRNHARVLQSVNDDARNAETGIGKEIETVGAARAAKVARTDGGEDKGEGKRSRSRRKRSGENSSSRVSGSQVQASFEYERRPKRSRVQRWKASECEFVESIHQETSAEYVLSQHARIQSPHYTAILKQQSLFL